MRTMQQRVANASSLRETGISGRIGAMKNIQVSETADMAVPRLLGGATPARDDGSRWARGKGTEPRGH